MQNISIKTTQRFLLFDHSKNYYKQHAIIGCADLILEQSSSTLTFNKGAFKNKILTITFFQNCSPSQPETKMTSTLHKISNDSLKNRMSNVPRPSLYFCLVAITITTASLINSQNHGQKDICPCNMCPVS